MKAQLSAIVAALALAALILTARCTTTEPIPCEYPLVLHREIVVQQTISNLHRLAKGWMEKALVNPDEGIQHEDEEAGVVVGRGVLRQHSCGVVDVMYDFPYEFVVQVVDDVANATVTVGYGMGELQANVIMVTEAHLMPRRDYDELKAQVTSMLDDFARYVERGCLAIEHNSKGIAAAKAGDYEGAIREFTKAIELNPDWPASYDNRGIARRYLEDHEGAIADHTKAIELDPSCYGAYTNRGNTRCFQGDHEGAIADYSRAIEIDPDHFAAYFNRANAKAELGDYDGAIKDFTRSIELNPGYADALNNRGWIYVKQENYTNAALDLSRALAVRTEPSYYDTRGWALFFLGRFGEARENALAALRLDPAAFNARALLYRVELRQDSIEKANASLKRYIEAHRSEGEREPHFLVLRYFAGEVSLERLQTTSKWDDLKVALRDY